MLSRDSPSDLRSQARQIAHGAKSPRAAWGELKSWAAGKGPFAMRSAAIEFLSVYGRDPEAQLLMPEVMQSSSGIQMPQRNLMDLAINLRPGSDFVRPQFRIEPKSMPAKAQPHQVQLKTSLELPRRPEPLQFDATKSPDSRVMSASKGHHIVRSLIHKIKSHASDAPHNYQGEPMKKKAKSKKMTKRKPAKKASKKKSRKR